MDPRPPCPLSEGSYRCAARKEPSPRLHIPCDLVIVPERQTQF
jgi:hypothetical protein